MYSLAVHSRHRALLLLNRSLVELRRCFTAQGDHSRSKSNCGSVPEDTSLLLACPNSTISGILFGQYGTPSGACPASGLRPGKCSKDLVPALQSACVGKESCTLECRSCGESEIGTESRLGIRRKRDHEVTAATRLASAGPPPPPPPCANSCSIDGQTIVSHDPCEGTKKVVAAAVSCSKSPHQHPPPELPLKQAYIVDFGQNIAGKVRIKAPLQAKDGQTITVRHCEVLEHPPLSDVPESERGCYYGELVNALNVDKYILSSDPKRNGEWLEPEFTIHGFRHAEIFGLESLSADQIEAVVIGSNISRHAVNSSSAGLKLGSALLQKIQNATVWSHRANTQDIFTDCNQRDGTVCRQSSGHFVEFKSIRLSQCCLSPSV